MQKSIVIILCWLVLPLKADFFSALDAYESGQFESAYKEFKEIAAVGEKRAQFNLGVMYFQGQYVEKDINQAYAWIKLATDSEIMNEVHLNALKQIENQLPDKLAAESIYQELSNLYSTEVLLDSLYPKLVTPQGTTSFQAEPQDIVPPRYPKKAALKGIQGWARFTFDLDKEGVPRNIYLVESIPKGVFDKVSIKAIVKWRFTPAIDLQGNKVAQKNLRYTLRYNLKGSGPITLKEGVYEEQLKLAQQGDPNAQFRVGIYEQKLNVSKGKENPSKWFLEAAKQGQIHAQYQIGQSLVFGQGCLQDQSKGIEWLARAATNGQLEAKQLLASTSSQINSLESHQLSIEYSKDLNFYSPRLVINQAWMYITSPYQEIRDPERAIELLNKLPRNSFKDDITKYEIKAAALAALGKFKKAVSYQQDALEEAKDRSADLELIKTRLASYQKKQTWF